jgi:hypothetical protein
MFTAILGALNSLGGIIGEVAGIAAPAGATIVDTVSSVGKSVAAAGSTLGDLAADGASALADGVKSGALQFGKGFSGQGIAVKDAAGDIQWGDTLARAAGAYTKKRVESKLPFQITGQKSTEKNDFETWGEI